MSRATREIRSVWKWMDSEHFMRFEVCERAARVCPPLSGCEAIVCTDAGLYPRLVSIEVRREGKA